MASLKSVDNSSGLNVAPQIAITNGPEELTNVRDLAISIVATASPSLAIQSVTCQLDAEPAVDCLTSYTVSGLADGNHVLKIQAKDTRNQVTDLILVWRIDGRAPIVTINQAPPSVIGSTSTTVAFSATEQSTFQCSLDAGAWTACTSPHQISNLSVAMHTIKIRARDLAGNVSVENTQTFRVDLTAPIITLINKPLALTSATTANFTFTGTDEGVAIASFTCQLTSNNVAGAAAPCNAGSVNYTNLAAGIHTFSLRGIDNVGNMSAATIYTWVIDLMPPSAPTIMTSTTNPTKDTTARFQFMSSDANGIRNYECVMDNVTENCAVAVEKVYAGLSSASHTFRVRAFDNVGNASAFSTFTWVVDTALPVVSIQSSVASGTISTSATMTVTSSDVGSGIKTLECSLDNGGFAVCTSPKAYTGLGIGNHSFQARVSDNAGNQSVATFNWAIAPPPPTTVTLTANPTSVAMGAKSTLTWSTANATSCVASGAWTGNQPTSGTFQTQDLTTASTFTLTCTGLGGSAAASVMVSIFPAPTVTLDVNPASVASGAKTALTWSSTNATSCTASGAWSGSQGTAGSIQSSALTSNSTFTLTCTGPGGTASDSASVTILPAPTVTLSANPTSVASGTKTTLTWNSTNSTACVASGAWTGNQATSGSVQSADLTAPSTFTLTCTGPGGSATASANVAILAFPTVTLAANPTAVASGATSTLTWSSTNSTACTSSGAWTGARTTSGTFTSSALTANSTFTLTCTGPGGSATATSVVTILPAPTVTLTANPTAVASGAKSTLTWNSTNATSCVASGAWTGNQATSGTVQSAALTSASTFTLTCTGAGGTATASANVSILAGPTVSITANPTSVPGGTKSTLTWTSTNTTSCVASGAWTGNQPTSGSAATADLTANSTFTLTCTGPGGTATDSATVSILPLPTVTLAANPTAVASGAKSTLTWATTNATTCTASGAWTGNQTTSGTTQTAALTTNSTFTLTCTGPGGSATATANVSILAGPTVEITANPTAIPGGTKSTLNWTSTNTTSCVASGAWTGSQATTGTVQTADLNANSTFTLTCTGPGGTATDSVTVSILPLPTVTLAANPTSVASGEASVLTWSTTNATACTSSGSWTGARATAGTFTTPDLTSAATYTLTCTGPGGSASATANVSILLGPTLALTANPTAVASGAKSTLSWITTNATACTASGAWTGSQVPTGTFQTAALTSDSTFTLTCTGPGGSTTASTTVTILAAPTVNLTANPTSVPTGTKSSLSWNTTNATSCVASGAWTGTQATSGSAQTADLTTNSTFTLTCTGPGGSASDSASVSVLPLPTVTLAANPTAVASGSTSTLTWNSTNATACTASGSWTGNIGPSGTYTTGPLTVASTFNITCTGAGGSANATASVSILPAPTVVLSANPTSVTSGTKTTLSWASTNATSCVASGAWSGNQATSGSVQSSDLTSDSTFTLTCSGAGGSATDSVNVAVVAAPPADPTEDSASQPGPFQVLNYNSGIPDGTLYAAPRIWYPSNGSCPCPGMIYIPDNNTTYVGSAQIGWAEFLASHGFIVMFINPENLSASQSERANSLLQAIEGFATETARAGSPIQGKLNANNIGVFGHAFGGAGALYAADAEVSPRLKVAMGLSPDPLIGYYQNVQVPTLIFGGVGDSYVQTFPEQYDSIPMTTPKMLALIKTQPDYPEMNDIATNPLGIHRTDPLVARYALSFLKVYMLGDMRYLQFLITNPSLQQFSYNR